MVGLITWGDSIWLYCNDTAMGIVLSQGGASAGKALQKPVTAPKTVSQADTQSNMDASQPIDASQGAANSVPAVDGRCPCGRSVVHILQVMHGTNAEVMVSQQPQ